MLSALDPSIARDEPKAGPWHDLCLSVRHLRKTEKPMTKNIIRIGLGGGFCSSALVCATLLVVMAPVPVDAQVGPRRARVSRDVAERLARGTEASTDVIVAAADGAIDQLALRYGARVKRRIRGGAVLEVTGGQLEAISEDADVAHVAGDVPVQRMGLTTEATGADQVWKGLPPGRGATGRGIGVAVIDSGIAVHAALRGRVVASVDFPGGRLRRCTMSTGTARTSPRSSPAATPTGTAGWRPAPT